MVPQTRDCFLARYPALPNTETKDFSGAIPRFDIHTDKRILLRDTPLCHTYRQETFFLLSAALPYTQTRDISPDIPRFAIDIEKRLFSHDHPLWYTHRQETFLAQFRVLPCTQIEMFLRYHTLCHTQRQETFLALSHVLPYIPIESFLTLYRALSYTERCFSRFAVHINKRIFSCDRLPYIQTRDVSKRDQPLCLTYRQENFLA